MVLWTTSHDFFPDLELLWFGQKSRSTFLDLDGQTETEDAPEMEEKGGTNGENHQSKLLYDIYIYMIYDIYIFIIYYILLYFDISYYILFLWYDIILYYYYYKLNYLSFSTLCFYICFSWLLLYIIIVYYYCILLLYIHCYYWQFR